ncbi:MAG: recombination mediator RecR [Patescibacteria group bacterium]|nr:recombination mediator RecR [Patescibacteria group bacterium]
MQLIPKNVQSLIDEFSKLPGIGPKSAQRLTFYLLRGAKKNIGELGQAVLDLKNDLKICSNCFNIAENDPCVLCGDERRDREVICIVEEPLDIIALEKTGKFEGLYHVLHGAISPVDGIGPEDLYISQLLSRVKNNGIKEIIIATNPDLEGEATAMYIHKLIEHLGIKITRIAHGLPMGADIEYADEITLSRALEGRREY